MCTSALKNKPPETIESHVYDDIFKENWGRLQGKLTPGYSDPADVEAVVSYLKSYR